MSDVGVQQPENPELEVKYLGDEAIYFYTKPKKGRSKVPPPTPSYDMDFERNLEIPVINVGQIDEIPEVQEEGIKFTIENLGRRLGCDNYEYDLIQFWFLDILTDCMWKAQDIFQFTSIEQKIILKWVTEIFKIIAGY